MIRLRGIIGIGSIAAAALFLAGEPKVNESAGAFAGQELQDHINSNGQVDCRGCCYTGWCCPGTVETCGSAT